MKKELRTSLFGGFRKKDVEKLIAAYDQQVEQLKHAAESAKEENTDLEDTVITMSGQLSDVQQNLNKYLSSTSWLKAQIARLSGENVRLKQQLEEKDHALYVLEKQRVQIEFKHNMLKSKLKKLTAADAAAAGDDDAPDPEMQESPAPELSESADSAPKAAAQAQ